MRIRAGDSPREARRDAHRQDDSAGAARGFDFGAGQFLTVVRVDGQGVRALLLDQLGAGRRGYLEDLGQAAGARVERPARLDHGPARRSPSRPAGAFPYPAGDDRPILLLAAASGSRRS